MKRSWLSTVFPIAAIFSFRMLGLFMLIPVFTIYASHLTSATPALIGIALGGYGLSQGLLQIPFGMLSDRLGRKPVITVGLILFALGSVIGACSTSIYSMILARILQGSGAIGSVLLALLADLTPDVQRTKAMAVLGVTIGLSFSLAMIISPVLTQHFGLAGIFYATTFLAVLGLIFLHTLIQTPKRTLFHLDSDINPKLFKKVVCNRHLQRLNFSIFCQHFIFTATFFAIPVLLQKAIQQGHVSESWHFYLPLLVLSFFAMVPFIIVAEKKQKMKEVFLGSVLATGLCEIVLATTLGSWYAMVICVCIYLIAFNILEASLPSLVSRQATPDSKGTAMGIYSSSQFLGIFMGGSASGIVYHFAGDTGIFLMNGLISAIWLIATLSIRPNMYQLTLILTYNPNSHDTASLTKRLQALAGVSQAVLSREEAVVYLRIDKLQYQEGSAERLLNG